MARETARSLPDNWHEELWAAGLLVSPAPGAESLGESLPRSSFAATTRGRADGRVLMAARVRCHRRRRRHLTAPPDNSRHLPTGTGTL